MTITEILQFADRLVFAHRGKHLDDIQETVIKGVWQGKTYENIAQECNRSESRVRDVGYQLWKTFSESLGEDINKSNFRSSIERLHIQEKSSIYCNFNFGSQTLYQYQKYPQYSQIKDIAKTTFQDLSIAPTINPAYFYGRTKELEILSNYIFHQKTRLMAVLGLSGIGKTTLVKRFIDLNIQQFDVVIWRNLKLVKSLNSLMTDLLKKISIENQNILISDEQLTQFLDLLSKQKCLIVLDDVQNIFISRKFAGQYQTQHTEYQNLFQAIAQTEHQSCVILISQEKAQEMTALDRELYPIQCLELGGLDNSAGIEIIKEYKLQDRENWLNLNNMYIGNPLYLQYICTLIKDIFQDLVSQLIAEGNLIITEEMKLLFDTSCQRMSDVEKQIVLTISKCDENVSIEDLKKSCSLSSIDIVNGLQSLKRRYLLHQIKTNNSLFSLPSLFKEYIKNFQMQN
ncbi:MAG: ATP-binding protein [Okeania sp. SIO2G4]|uniref:NB-ARC domain-containing protein n=1 Tax=unclassified Okeania TaxID=2634635 RepID=UPI0013BC9801|nr:MULTISPECIES: ATP-binding protein [unclassified Okeania]NEP38069.1 ATP-binding protein [Okeania sp. SIO2H7]NEP72740.1 ATP-binding protein [Okeania sp. SIO2G5]NEP93374.1 ATP-binding protein [Okeania sp. SIO2F5]NEQ91386.1 ATP-binding protein [Okeania sp. SIO2G4]